jgi:hypothetical protein
MSMQLPAELAEFLSFLGFDWPDSDEDKLAEMGRAWSSFATTLTGLNADAGRHAEAVWAENSGQVIQAFQQAWTGPQAPITNLREGAEAATMIAAGLSTAATLVVALKLKMIQEVASFARVCWIAARAARTPWTAVGAGAAVIIARIVAVAAINAAMETAIRALLDE